MAVLWLVYNDMSGFDILQQMVILFKTVATVWIATGDEGEKPCDFVINIKFRNMLQTGGYILLEKEKG